MHLEQEVVELARFLGEMPIVQGYVNDLTELHAYCNRRDPPLQVYSVHVLRPSWPIAKLL